MEFDDDTLDLLADAIKADPSFIGEAIANIDVTDLVTAFKSVDLQHCWDAIADIVDAHYAEQLKFQRGEDDTERAEKLAALHGVVL